MENSTITITFCDTAENHVGMEKIGENNENGFFLGDLLNFRKYFEKKHAIVKLIDLNYPIENLNIYPNDEAYILIVRRGIDILLENFNSSDLFDELIELNWDTKAKMYGRVVNKNARYNLCFSDFKQKPNYEQGKGRIIAFEDVPILNTIRKKLIKLIGISDIVAEGNYYYDVTKCGIGFHGDAERKLVIGTRLGASMPLEYQWFFESKPIGERIHLELNDGDIYFMSEKATGNDWKSRSIYTLRHAAGSDKFIKVKI